MCAQCMVGAMAAGTAATGLRVYLVAHLGPRTRKVLTGVLIAGGVLAAGFVGPSP